MGRARSTVRTGVLLATAALASATLAIGSSDSPDERNGPRGLDTSTPATARGTATARSTATARGTLTARSTAAPPGGTDSASSIGTPGQREALFEDLVRRTLEREAFSPVKEARLEVDVRDAMEACRASFLEADDEVDLYYALVRLSAARKDRHLAVRLVRGGLAPQVAFDELAARMGYEEASGLAAPIRFRAGFEDRAAPVVYVSDVGAAPGDTVPLAPAIGDVLTHVNGRPLAEVVRDAEPYRRYSTRENLWMRLAMDLNRLSLALPPRFYDTRLRLGLDRADGSSYELVLDYLPEEEIEWQGHDAPRYPGFVRRRSWPSFTLHTPADDRPVVLLEWHQFGSDLPRSLDEFMELVTANGWLQRDVVVDATRARGGANGAEAIRRLTGRPFTLTFGNLRVSEVTPRFVRNRAFLGAGGSGWTADWLENDVMDAVERGLEYTPPVPFKCAHAPKDSDGVLQPADVHLEGRLVCWFGPQGGSHLDQFAAMVIDNGLGHSMGMPTGGYSNTWEWTEIVRMPDTRRPLASFMWSIGQTLRPNGEILEGNPPEVAEWFPPTPARAGRYHALLLERTLRRLDTARSRR